MPWIETDAMQQRVLFLKAWLSQRYTKTELCQQFNISRPTADKWIKRHQQLGFEVNLIIALMPRHNGFMTGLSVRNLNVLTGEPKKKAFR